MPILFTAISRGTTVLARYANCPGNFTEVSAQILDKITPVDKKLSYSHGPYLFHYICEKRIIYLCITDDKFESSLAFTYLEEIKNKFLDLYKFRIDFAEAYEMNYQFSLILAYQMKRYNEAKDGVVPAKVHGNLNELQEIMIKNTDQIAMREQFEMFIKKTGKTIHPVPSTSCFSSKITFCVIVVLLLALILLFLISAVQCLEDDTEDDDLIYILYNVCLKTDYFPQSLHI